MAKKHERRRCSLLALAMGLTLATVCAPAGATEFEEAQAALSSVAKAQFWRLDIGHDKPASIELRDYDGQKRQFWYLPVVIGNFTDQERKFSATSAIATDVAEPVYCLAHPALFKSLSRDRAILTLLAKLRKRMVMDKKEEFNAEMKLFSKSVEQVRAAAERSLNQYRKQYFLDKADRMTERMQLSEKLLKVIDDNIDAPLAVADSVNLLEFAVGSGKIAAAILIFPDVDPRAREVRILLLGTTNAYATSGDEAEEEFLNGVYQIYYTWPGDPYNRQRDPLVLEREGYVWVR